MNQKTSVKRCQPQYSVLRCSEVVTMSLGMLVRIQKAVKSFLSEQWLQGLAALATIGGLLLATYIFVVPSPLDTRTQAEQGANRNAKSIASSEIPSYLALANPPEPMFCQVGDPFSPSRYVLGTHSLETEARGTLYIICPKLLEYWNDYSIPIGWFDQFGNGYTDCRKESWGHSCWITIPQDQL